MRRRDLLRCDLCGETTRVRVAGKGALGVVPKGWTSAWWRKGKRCDAWTPGRKRRDRCPRCIAEPQQLLQLEEDAA